MCDSYLRVALDGKHHNTTIGTMQAKSVLFAGAALLTLVLLCSEQVPSVEAVRVIHRVTDEDKRLAHVLSSPNTPKCPKHHKEDIWGYCRKVVQF